MNFPQQNVNMNSFKSNMGFFCFGIVVTSAIITFWRTPNKDWAPYIEDRNIFWNAQADSTSQKANRNIWSELQRINNAVEDMERPNSMYNEIMVQRAVRIFAQNAVTDYMNWNYDDSSESLDLPSTNK